MQEEKNNEQQGPPDEKKKKEGVNCRLCVAGCMLQDYFVGLDSW